MDANTQPDARTASARKRNVERRHNRAQERHSAKVANGNAHLISSKKQEVTTVPIALDAHRSSALSENAPLNLSPSTTKTKGWTEIGQHDSVTKAPCAKHHFVIATCQVGPRQGHGLLDVASTNKDQLFMWIQSNGIDSIEKFTFQAANTSMSDQRRCLRSARKRVLQLH